MPAIHRFGPFELRTASRTLLRDGEPVAALPRQVAILALLLSKPGALVTKDDVMAAGWNGAITSEDSVDKAMSELRRLLGDAPAGGPYVETVRRQGYRFTAAVSRDEGDALDALLRPHRRWIEGRAALETLHVDQVERARVAFDEAVRCAPQHAPAHVGLANASAMRFESTRADAEPDVAALLRAVRHAHVACQLDPEYAEAWATLGFALARATRHVDAQELARLNPRETTPADALAAARRATMIEKENWRHQVRLASVAWGEERLAAVRRALSKAPRLPLAHLLAATVFVARQTFADAERKALAGIAADEARAAGAGFSGVAVHWLHGLLRLAVGDRAGAEAAFMREFGSPTSPGSARRATGCPRRSPNATAMFIS